MNPMAPAAVAVMVAFSVARHDVPATFSTLITTPLAIEGLTADHDGQLYTGGRAAAPSEACPVWRINPTNPSLVVVGFLPAPCSPTGILFNAFGDLFVSNGDHVDVLRPNAATPPMATTFASGVPGTNGLAFDRHGNLWTSDGVTGLGRVWRISPAGAVTEMFRIQPMRNSTALGGVIAGDGVGRQARTFPPGGAANTVGGQDLVANGLQFTESGDLLIADTARGAIWSVSFDAHGEVRNRMGCDATFAARTLCLDSIWIAHPLLEGIDGIALDRAGNVWADANERNAVVFVKRNGDVSEVFRNPAGRDGLRNAGPLEFPTSPVLFRRSLCTANSDGNRRDNSPNTAGELGGLGGPRGKISCMDQRAAVPGVDS
jgi:sugar lactone lactonase YvrE